MEKKIFKIGIMGGRRGKFVLFCEQFLKEDMEVTALLETRQAALDELRESGELKDSVKVYSDFDEFLHSGIDAIILCNYFHEHASYAIKALEAGVAVLSDTTAGASLGDCVKLVEAVERTGGKYMLGANCVFYRGTQVIKKRLEENKYGPIIFADAEYNHPIAPDTNVTGITKNIDKENLHWRMTLPNCYYNMHDLGPLMFMTNTMPKKVLCKAVVKDFTTKPLVKTDKCYTMVEMDNGAVFNYSGWTNVGSPGKWFRIACADATIESVRYNPNFDQIIEMIDGEMKTTDISWVDAGLLTEEEYNKYAANGEEEFASKMHGGIDFIMMLHFIKYLRGEAEPFFNVYRAVALSATSIYAWYSALSGSCEFEIPDLSKKEDRDRVRNDFRMPFAKRFDDLTLPCSVEDAKAKGFKV